jgi:hypothetical protein
MEDKVKERAKKARDAVEKEARQAAEQAKKVAAKLQEEVSTPLPSHHAHAQQIPQHTECMQPPTRARAQHR